MKQKMSLLIITLILILPMALYAIFKMPENSAAIAATGKPTVLEFSSPMCSECIKLKKTLDVVEPMYSSKIAFNKINTARMDRATVKQIQKYDVKVVPTLIYIDKNGKVLFKTEGAVPQEKMCENIDRLLK